MLTKDVQLRQSWLGSISNSKLRAWHVGGSCGGAGTLSMHRAKPVLVISQNPLVARFESGLQSKGA